MFDLLINFNYQEIAFFGCFSSLRMSKQLVERFEGGSFIRGRHLYVMPCNWAISLQPRGTATFLLFISLVHNRALPTLMLLASLLPRIDLCQRFSGGRFPTIIPIILMSATTQKSFLVLGGSTQEHKNPPLCCFQLVFPALQFLLTI